MEVSKGVLGSGQVLHTRWAVRVVFRERHPCLEVAAVVEGVRVEHDESNAPLEDVIVDQLRLSVDAHTITATHGRAATSMFVQGSLDSVLYSFMRIREAMVTYAQVSSRPAV